jgi:hypothetical protein
MKLRINVLFLSAIMVFLSCSGDENSKLIKEIEAQVAGINAKLQILEKKSFENKQNNEKITGYYGEDGRPSMISFDSYPDNVKYYYNSVLVCIVHNQIDEENNTGTESKYYYKNGNLFHHTVNNEIKEITPEIENASKELIGIESEYIKALDSKSQGYDMGQVPESGLSFLAGFVDKPSFDVSNDERLITRLKNLVKNTKDYDNLIAQLAYGDEIQKFNNVILINGEVRHTIDEDGNQVTFVSIIAADLVNDVLSVGMTDEEGNTSIFYSEAPGKKHPKQFVDWFTQEYKTKFRLEAE